ncbi:MAG: Phosphorylase, family 2 [Candidatus Woesebacteria bacterium GW2011_GWB1_43_14]|uniref:Phosphorylase, family 2 n=1 Tax=Candidatus Woesebacteria bacterium GW2011_GWB1_43_14 TaxID=1618578 RepID=A0A0G1DHI7_9BACT|nr:MAG: Phosphorylase, family 2 [Candidatus Woesebacteria bacterium GW2011_GWC1_42_9]KKS97330.1 MAG: Phosphorylase, family 2 [Candidatus Woesebacteria bacterium GW2011_GWB1_43_14]
MSNLEARYGLIGGSNTWAIQFPEETDKGIRVVKHIKGFSTPFGVSSPYKLLEINGVHVLRVAMHGSYPNDQEMIPPNISAKQTAWIFKQAGVKYALVDASVGGIQNLEGGPLPPWSIVIPDDFFMAPTIPMFASSVGRVPRDKDKTFFRMAKPFCEMLRRSLMKACKEEGLSFQDGGVYACTPWGRFETVPEISILRNNGAHVVGQTVAHEAVAMRNAEIHFASINIVSNFAENGHEWIGDCPDAMANFYRECAPITARLITNAMKAVINDHTGNCQCREFEVSGLGKFPIENA